MHSAIARVSTYALGLALIVGALATTLVAGSVQPAPEIDGSSIATGLALAGGAVLILRSRRRSK
jgi:hypothetical protein